MPSADGGLVGRAVGSIRERRLVPGHCPCSDVVGGVDGVAVLVDLEVEVAAGRPARVTDLGDGLAGRDARADRYREAQIGRASCRERRVRADEVKRMIEERKKKDSM